MEPPYLPWWTQEVGGVIVEFKNSDRQPCTVIVVQIVKSQTINVLIQAAILKAQKATTFLGVLHIMTV